VTIDGPDSLSDGELGLGGLLLGDSHGGFISSSDVLRLLGDVELDVAVRGQIGRDATVGSVCSSSAADGSLGANVGNCALFWVERLGQGI
jgi:hypothetical protein